MSNLISNLADKAKSASQQSDEDVSSVASGLRARAQNVSDYNNQVPGGLLGGAVQSNPQPTPVDQGSSPKDKVNPKGKYGDRKGEKRIDTSSMTKPLGLKKGASKIKKARIVKVHKGEAVVPASRQKKAAKSGLLKGLTEA